MFLPYLLPKGQKGINIDFQITLPIRKQQCVVYMIFVVSNLFWLDFLTRRNQRQSEGGKWKNVGTKKTRI